MILFKLTNRSNFSGFNNNLVHWGENVTHEVYERRDGPLLLCTDDVIHAYMHPIQALVFDMYHRGFIGYNGKLWVAKGNIVIQDYEKCGVFELTTIKQIPIPKLTKNDIKLILGDYCKCVIKSKTNKDVLMVCLTQWFKNHITSYVRKRLNKFFPIKNYMKD